MNRPGPPRASIREKMLVCRNDLARLRRGYSGGKRKEDRAKEGRSESQCNTMFRAEDLSPKDENYFLPDNPPAVGIRVELRASFAPDSETNSGPLASRVSRENSIRQLTSARVEK